MRAMCISLGIGVPKTSAAGAPAAAPSGFGTQPFGTSPFGTGT